MKKLIMILFVVIMFFGIVGSTLSDDSAPKATTSNVATKPSVSVYTLGGDSASPVPEPITLLLLGSGLVTLAAFGRKKLKK